MRQAMAVHGLYPRGVLVANDAYHRFPGREKSKSNRAGWYRVPVDQRVVFFGDYSQGLSTYWRDETWKRPPLDEWKKIQRRQARLKKNREEAAETSRGTMRKIWANATVLDPKTHPYFEAKDIDPTDCQVRRYRDDKGTDMLLCPLYLGRKLVGIQRIFTDGRKRFFFGMQNFDGGSVRFSGGSRVIYLCEGWATAWSIWKSTKCSVIACYSTENLGHVAARAVEKLSDARIIIAADNDRWSTYYAKGGGEKPNPGVAYARSIAAAHDLEVAIPDFVDLTGEPTDYDDLRRLEGEPAVRRWLDPDIATDAVTEPSEASDEPTWLDEAPFIARGMVGDRYLLVRKDTGAPKLLTASQLCSQPFLTALAPKSWWDVQSADFFGTKNTSWMSLGGLLQGICEANDQVGNHARGRGVWREPAGIVVHCGDSLQRPNGFWTKPWLYAGANYIKPDNPDDHMGQLREEATVEETRRVAEAICDWWWWKWGASGELVTGWTLLAPIAACLRWRPHIWVNAPPSAGKSQLLTLLAGVSSFVQYSEGGTTRASLYRDLGGINALSGILDEMEPPSSDQARQRTYDDVIEYARKCSSGSTIRQVKGDTTVSYRAQSMFLFASIAGAVRTPQDQQRFTACEFIKPTRPDKLYLIDRADLDQQIRDGLPARILARTVAMLRDGRLDRAIDTFRNVFLHNTKSSRQADQLGSLMAGAWMMRHDDAPDALEAREWIGSMDWNESADSHGAATTPVTVDQAGRVVLDHLLQAGVFYDFDKKKTVLGALIIKAATMLTDVSEEAKTLRQWQIAVSSDWVIFGCKSRLIRRALKDTMYQDRWPALLADLPGATKPTAVEGGRQRFDGVRTMVVKVPLKEVIGS